MIEMSVLRPRYPILLSDLVLYLLALSDHHADIADQARRAIQEGRYYEQN